MKAKFEFNVIKLIFVFFLLVSFFRLGSYNDVVFGSTSESKPQFYGTTEITLRVGDSLNLYDSIYRIFAIDEKDGNITKNITVTKNNVNTNIIGEYEVKYKVKNSLNQESNITVPVHVLSADNERKIQRTLYTFPNRTYLDSTGFSRGDEHFAQNLGIFLPANVSVKMKFLNYDKIKSTVSISCLNNDRLKESRPSINISGVNSNYNVKIGNDSIIKLYNDEEIDVQNITNVLYKEKDSSDDYVVWDEYNGKSYDSVPMVSTLYGVSDKPVLEITLNDDVKSLDYYTYGDSMTSFKEKWQEHQTSLAVIEGSRSTFLVPLVDLEYLGVSKYNINSTKYKYDSFNSIDDILIFFDNVIDTYDKYIGLEENSELPENQNIKSRYLFKADIHGGGGASYTNYPSVNYTGNSLDTFLHRSGDGWSILHEIGHGYQSSLKSNNDLYLTEISNNFYAYYYQKRYFENADWLSEFKTLDETAIQMVREKDTSFLTQYSDDTNESQTHINRFKIRLFAYINLFNKLEDSSTVPENILAYTYRRYRNLIYNKISRKSDIIASNFYIESFSDYSKFNVIPYFEDWKLNINSDLKKEIYDKDYPLIYYLKDIVKTDATLNQIKSDLNLPWNYSLVSNNDLGPYNLKGNCTFKISNMDNILPGSKIVLKDGKNVIKNLNISNDTITLNDISAGIYEVEVQNIEGITYPRYVVIPEGTNTQYDIITDPPEIEVTSDYIISGDQKQWINEEMLNIHITSNTQGLCSLKIDGNSVEVDSSGNAEYKVDENGIYEIIATDSQGNTARKQVVVENIDNTKPRIYVIADLVGDDEWQKEVNVVIKVSSELDESGIKKITVDNQEVEFSLDESNEYQVANYTITENGAHYFLAWDNAGNYIKRLLYVYTIDNLPPDLEVEKANISDDKVELSINSSDLDSGLKEVKVTSDKIEQVLDINENGVCNITYDITQNGTYTITATDDIGNFSTQTIEINTIKEIKVTSITLNKTSYTFTDRTPLQLVATILPENATNKEITWETTRPGILLVDNTGKVTPGATQGGGMIIARAKDGSGKVATCNITINIGGSATYKKGDINKDGKVTVMDVRYGLKALTKGTKNRRCKWR